ncbi:MAG: DUF378 domain-containing protein [Parachlamydiales bacterium]|nr:DUF378 domain-containing protein [Parachlamydiales bacterium]
MKALNFVAKLLMVIGALNWGLVGFFGYDLVGDIFGGMDSGLARVVFAIVGLAGLYGLVCLFRCCSCGPSCGCHHKK